MASPFRGLAVLVVLALLGPVVEPLAAGSRSEAEECACRAPCCRSSQRPPENAPCHGPRRDSPTCSMRCDHAAYQASLASLGSFLPEADATFASIDVQTPLTRAPRPVTLAGFDRIESPPPRPLVLAI